MKAKKAKLLCCGIMLILITQITIVSNSYSQGIPRIMYIAPESENLRSSQNGPILGILKQGTSVAIVEEQDKWMKVQIVGWIWKGSLSSIKPVDKNAMYRGQYILVKTKAEADEILQLIRNGDDFSELAKQRSIASNAAKGGDLGYFHPEDFIPEISNAITNLKVGEVSGVVQINSGFAIFKRLK